MCFKYFETLATWKWFLNLGKLVMICLKDSVTLPKWDWSLNLIYLYRDLNNFVLQRPSTTPVHYLFLFLFLAVGQGKLFCSLNDWVAQLWPNIQLNWCTALRTTSLAAALAEPGPTSNMQRLTTWTESQRYADAYEPAAEWLGIISPPRERADQELLTRFYFFVLFFFSWGMVMTGSKLVQLTFSNCCGCFSRLLRFVVWSRAAIVASWETCVLLHYIHVKSTSLCLSSALDIISNFPAVNLWQKSISRKNKSVFIYLLETSPE